MFDIEKDTHSVVRRKLKYLQNVNDNSTIRYYLEWMSKRDDLVQLTHCATCPLGKHHKLCFEDGWCIIFEMRNDKAFFINFYKTE